MTKQHHVFSVGAAWCSVCTTLKEKGSQRKKGGRIASVTDSWGGKQR